MKKPRILLYDIETTPNVGFTWGKYDQNVIEFQSEWQLLSFAVKELGKPTVRCYSRRNFRDNTEKTLVKKLWGILDSADILITHNGVSFDNKKANAKFVEHGLPPVKPSQQVDTKRLAKESFMFNSNSLDDLGKLLGCGRKVKRMDFSVWLGCMSNDPEAFALMERYNKQDVVLLEKIYYRLRPWAKSHPNVSQISEKPDACPRCGHDVLRPRGFKFTPKHAWHQYQCTNCGGYCRGESVSLFKPKYTRI